MNKNKVMLGKLSINVVIIICITVIVYPAPAKAQQAHIYEKKQVIKTYPFSNPDPVIYKKVIYPYFRFDGYSFKGKPKKWKVVTLENPYIKLWVLPGVGGKVWGAKEKSTGRDFIYHNDVLKFRDIALRGPWTSGGIEFNFLGIVGHTPHAAASVDYLLKKNKDGSVSCWIGGVNWNTRAHWAVEIQLPKDAAMFKTKGFYYNATPLNQPYYYWSNAAIPIHVGDSVQYDYPATYYERDGGQPWPITKDGRDISYYKNMRSRAGDYFLVGKYANYYGAYWHKLNFGFGHWAHYNDMPGKKVFIWGRAPSGAIWKNLLTDNNGQYTEVQTGRLYSQFALKHFNPERADRWKGNWFPIKDIGGVNGASPYAAINVKQNSKGLTVAVNALKAIQDTLKIFKKNKLIHKEVVHLQPMGVFKTTFKNASKQGHYEVKLGEQLTVSTSPDKNLLHRPAPATSNQHIDSTTAEGLFQMGERSFERMNYNQAIRSYLKSLRIDENNQKVLTKLAEAYTHKSMYQEALKYANKALGLDTYDSETNFIYGVLNRRMGSLNQAKAAFGWAARSLKYRSAGYEQIAEINIRQHDWKDAIYYAGNALNFNKFNMSARKMLAVSYRKEKKVQKANKGINKMLKINPLNHFAYFEKYLLHSTDENLKPFTSLISSELPYETYLEIAMTYYHIGLKDEAIKVLKISPSNPIVNYWLAYLNRGNTRKSRQYLEKTSSTSPRLVFPFRYETIPVLNWALTQNNNWETKYYLGLILWSKGRNAKSLSLMNECGENPDYAPFYLTRSKMRKTKNPNKSLRDLKQALELNKGQWRTYRALASWYMSNDKIEAAKKISERGYGRFPKNYYLGTQYAGILLKAGDYKKSFNLLNNLNVLPSEGAKRAHSIFEQSLIKLATQNMHHGKYQEALKHLKTSRTWPEHLGTGSPSNPDERIQNYLTAKIYEGQHKSELADSFYHKIYVYSKQIDHKGKREFNYHSLVTLLTYEHLDKRQQARNLYNHLVKNIDNQNIIAWLEAQSGGNESKVEMLRNKLIKQNASEIPDWFRSFLQL